MQTKIKIYKNVVVEKVSRIKCLGDAAHNRKADQNLEIRVRIEHARTVFLNF